jgi:hypothetical protein
MKGLPYKKCVYTIKYCYHSRFTLEQGYKSNRIQDKDSLCNNPIPKIKQRSGHSGKCKLGTIIYIYRLYPALTQNMS